jgi:ABC-type transporter Mla subunit MlaD
MQFKEWAMQKLTDAEKLARGTRQKSRAIKPRKRAEIRADIHNVQQCIQDMQHNLTEAAKEIRSLGMFVEVTVSDSSGTAHITRRLNPAFKVQKDAMTALRGLQRHLKMLREEEAAATVKDEEKAAANVEEFSV